MQKLLVIAPTPPPYHGAAMMIEKFIKGEFRSIEIYHIRVNYSKSISSLGRFSPSKVLHMFYLLRKAIAYTYKFKISAFYYIPGGTSKTPVYRDLFILTLLRLIFKKCIFHFHAAGISEIVESLPSPLKSHAKRIYGNADLAIYLSSLNPDHTYFKAKRTVMIPNGLEDSAVDFLPVNRPIDPSRLSLLYVGIIRETKGVSVLLEALVTLKDRGIPFRCTIVGDFVSREYREEVMFFCEQNGLLDSVEFPGVVYGDEKWKYFRVADIFCFPSYYSAESFGNVLVEAMMFELPIVTTEWRGIPDVVQHDTNGMLVPVKDKNALARAIIELVQCPEKRKRYGRQGREIFHKKFHLPVFITKMEQEISGVLEA